MWLGLARNVDKDARIPRKGGLAQEVRAQLLLVLCPEGYLANLLIPHLPAVSRSTPENARGKVEVLVDLSAKQRLNVVTLKLSRAAPRRRRLQQFAEPKLAPGACALSYDGTFSIVRKPLFAAPAKKVRRHLS